MRLVSANSSIRFEDLKVMVEFSFFATHCQETNNATVDLSSIRITSILDEQTGWWADSPEAETIVRGVSIEEFREMIHETMASTPQFHKDVRDGRNFTEHERDFNVKE